MRARNGTHEGIGISGEDGRYTIAGLAPGRYEVLVDDSNAWIVTTEQPLSVVVVSRRVTGGVDFGIVPRPRPTIGHRIAPLPSPIARDRATPAPSPSPAPIVEPTPAPSPTLTISGELILAGLGMHWLPPRPTDPVFVPQLPMVAIPAVDPADDRIRATWELPRHLLGQLQAWVSADSTWLGVPFKSQIDGSEFADANCGPASLAMVLAAYGFDVHPAAVRDHINYLTGHYALGTGTSLQSLALVAAEAGLTPRGAGHQWTFDEIRESVRAGQPVITLVKYRDLPGNGASLAEFDHYIVITGVHGDDLIYNDAAFATTYGFNLLISRDALERAWSFASIPGHALAISLDGELRPLAIAPAIVSAAILSGEPEAAPDEPMIDADVSIVDDAFAWQAAPRGEQPVQIEPAKLPLAESASGDPNPAPIAANTFAVTDGATAMWVEDAAPVSPMGDPAGAIGLLGGLAVLGWGMRRALRGSRRRTGR